MSELLTNIIYCGDCLKKLKEIPDESIDLIYIDPPFSSNRNYVAFWQEQEKRHFEDRFEDARAYVDYMSPRLKELYRVLKNTGLFFYHCDWHAAHYIKVLLDRDDYFGYNNFRNNIVWHYTGRRMVSQNKFNSKHDDILFYAKSEHGVIYNYPSEKYTREEYLQMKKQELHRDEDGREWIWGHAGKGKSHEYKIYIDEVVDNGRAIDDVWDIPIINTSAKERLGYPTQKPLTLLNRIVGSCSKDGDVILDAFCGCGTTIVASQLLKRKWIGIDISPTACRVMAQRLESMALKEGGDFIVRDMPKSVEELRVYPAFEFQNWAINAIGGIPNKARVRDMGIDGKLYPIEDIQKEKSDKRDLFGEIDNYIPIQVKRTDQVGRPEIDGFITAMKRDKRNQGIFVGFDFSRDADKEIRRAEREEGITIRPIKVSEIIELQLDKSLK
ncbi:MAG: hypothetical protein C4542_03120 [Dehalococcoidia bacterium]|nr:MAG: hypothetical protein C4542_03120 [Dehalococcoidia bacterium]